MFLGVGSYKGEDEDAKGWCPECIRYMPPGVCVLDVFFLLFSVRLATRAQESIFRNQRVYFSSGVV